MNLYSTSLPFLWLEAAGSGPSASRGELPDEERVNSSRHTRFPELEGIHSFRVHHASERQHRWSEWSVRRRVPASRFPCHSAEVFLDEFDGPLGRGVVVCGSRGSVAGWESWEASETMAMSISSLERPLKADVIITSFLRCVPAINGSRLATLHCHQSSPNCAFGVFMPTL